jgi:hypothetical protein
MLGLLCRKDHLALEPVSEANGVAGLAASNQAGQTLYLDDEANAPVGPSHGPDRNEVECDVPGKVGDDRPQLLHLKPPAPVFAFTDQQRLAFELIVLTLDVTVHHRLQHAKHVAQERQNQRRQSDASQWRLSAPSHRISREQKSLDIVMRGIDLTKNVFALRGADGTGTGRDTRSTHQSLQTEAESRSFRPRKQSTANKWNPVQRLTSGSAPPAVQQGRLQMCSLVLVSMRRRRMPWREVRNSNTVLRGVELQGSLCRRVGHQFAWMSVSAFLPPGTTSVASF